ncbi:hypothetical protein E1A91_A11G158900v1 [Gossypium mustelinum]|uniref:Uncharacterized protein n=1 Tax=Gossypium mustelinum TaxID=34275 RepID=A0A5D2X7D3_GOSMU|nr:hypothetical protein E1A91_A11G158900v1 [Gossypium mustelinum]
MSKINIIFLKEKKMIKPKTLLAYSKISGSLSPELSTQPSLFIASSSSIHLYLSLYRISCTLICLPRLQCSAFWNLN